MNTATASPITPEPTRGRPYMSFGRYAGRSVVEVPADYLEWCLQEAQGVSPTLRAGIKQELFDRARHFGRAQ